MAVYLISREPKGRTLVHSQTENTAGLAICSEENSAGVVLCTKEYADEQFLMHYRVGGEKKGKRRWQNEDGSYTPEGYKHYAEMYGWGKFRADRAERKAAKYEDKAKKAEAELHKQQVKADKAQVKVDRNGNEKNIQKSQAATNRLHEAQLRFDQYRNKAEKYQSKTDRLHEKWDEQTRKLETKAENARKNEATGRYYRLATEAEGKGFGEAHAKYAKMEKESSDRAEKYNRELARRGIEPKGRLEDTPEMADMAKAGKEKQKDQLDKWRRNGEMSEADYAREMRERGLDSEGQAKADRDAEERVENNRYVEGSLAFRENAENERRMQDFDNLSAEDKRKTGDYLIKKLNDYNDVYRYAYGKLTNAKDLDDLDADVERQATAEYRSDFSWLVDKIDQVAGNENVGEYVKGSNAEKAHNQLEKSYDESWARREKLEKEAGIDYRKAQKSEKARQREYEKLKQILASDELYQALAANDKKNEEALCSAVLKDLGFSDTPTNRSVLFPIIFRD